MTSTPSSPKSKPLSFSHDQLDVGLRKAEEVLDAAQASVHQRYAGSTNEAVNVAIASVTSAEAALLSAEVSLLNAEEDFNNTEANNAENIAAATLSYQTSQDSN